MPIPYAEAKTLLSTFANVGGNPRARARERILALLTESTDSEADLRSLTMLAECRRLLADMTDSRDAAVAALRDYQATAAAKVPRR